MIRLRFFPTFLLLVPSLTSISAQRPASRYAITQDDVARALKAAGVTLESSQILTQAILTSAAQAPSLEVSFAGFSNPSSLRFRLACKVTSQCLPFFALAQFTGPNEAYAAQQTLLPRTLPAREKEVTVRPRLVAGQHASFLMDDDRMRIRVPVISIDSGPVGAEVRVTSLDRKQMYHGTVMNEETVRGTLH